MMAILRARMGELKSILGIMVILTAMALMLMYLFGIGFDEGYIPTVIIADEDSSNDSKAFTEMLISRGDFTYEIADLDEAISMVEDRKASIVVHIPRGMEKITVYRSDDDTVYHSLLSRMQSTLLVYDKEIDADAIKLNITNMEKDRGSGYTSLTHMFMGYILFYSMFTMVFAIGIMVEEKQYGIWNRQLVSPLSFTRILSANAIFAFVLGMLQMTIILLFSKYFFGIDMGGGVIPILFILSIYVLTIISLGLLLSSFLKTGQQLGAITPIILVATSMIGGCMWPLEIISSRILLFLAKLTPQRWAYLGLKKIIVDGAGIPDVMQYAGILLVFTAVLFGTSLLVFKRSGSV